MGGWGPPPPWVEQPHCMSSRGPHGVIMVLPSWNHENLLNPHAWLGRERTVCILQHRALIPDNSLLPRGVKRRWQHIRHIPSCHLMVRRLKRLHAKEASLVPSVHHAQRSRTEEGAPPALKTDMPLCTVTSHLPSGRALSPQCTSPPCTSGSAQMQTHTSSQARCRTPSSGCRQQCAAL